MRNAQRYFVVAIIAFCTALAAIWLVPRLSHTQLRRDGELHALMHDQLRLDPAQTARVEDLERSFAERRKVLDGQLRQSNAELATAISAEHAYGPRVAQAIDRSHMAMGELQKATLGHVFAMRAILRPDQTDRFDQGVAKALTAHGKN